MQLLSESVHSCLVQRSRFGLCLWVMAACIVSVQSEDNSDRTSDISRLRLDLLPSSSQAMKMVRPVVSENTSITLVVTIKMSDLISFELDKNEAVTQLKMCFSWYAETLTWDPAKYNGLNNLTVSAYEIWLPDVEVFNHVDFTREINYHIYKVRLSSDGMANWCPKVQSTVSCDTDMTHFPHDTHGCVLLIGSATYNFEQIKLKPVLIRDHEVSKSLVRSSNWDIKNVTFQVVKGRVSIDYYDYALHLTIIVKRRFSLHLFSFTLPLFTCAILTFIFCWLPLDDQKRFHLGLLSLILNVYLMTRYSDTLRHSTNTPWGLRFAGDLILFTCSMIVLQILCLTLEDVLIPFATHPSIDRFLSSTFVSSFVLNDHLILVNEEECDTEDTSSQPPPDATQMEVSPRKITEHSTKIGRVNENWRNLLVVIMRISVTLFLFIYAFVYFILDRMFIF